MVRRLSGHKLNKNKRQMKSVISSSKLTDLTIARDIDNVNLEYDNDCDYDHFDYDYDCRFGPVERDPCPTPVHSQASSLYSGDSDVYTVSTYADSAAYVAIAEGLSDFGMDEVEVDNLGELGPELGVFNVTQSPMSRTFLLPTLPSQANLYMS